MTLHTVAVDDVAPQVWRNGGGLTRELLTWPSAEAWGIRISVADVERDGAFSVFEGVERWFVVLEGGGVELRFDDGEARRVRAGDAPFRFDGGRRAHCALLSGATRDLNVMLVRKRGLVACEPATTTACAPRGELRALFAQDAASLVAGRETVRIAANSLAWSSESRQREWNLQRAARAWWIAFRSGASA